MRRIHWHLPVLFPLLILAAPAGAQEPEPPQPPANERTGQRSGGGEAGAEAPQNRRDGRRRGGRRGARRAPPVVIQAAWVHPVSGSAIENGVVVIRGERVVAVGKQGEVEVPEGATVRDFPTGHVYPGLIDAETDAFTDRATQSATLDPGMAIADDLQLRHDRDDELAAAGITTAYVSAPTGKGAIVRPLASGFELWEGKEQAAVQLRMTRGPVATHPLERQQQLDAGLKIFEGLDKYEKAKADYTKALDKYDEEFAEYLAYHEKNKGKKPAGDEPAATPPAGATPPAVGLPGREGRRGRRGERPPRGGGTQAGEELEIALEQLVALLLESEAAPPQDPPPAPPPKQDPEKGGAQGQAADGKSAAKKDEKKESGPPKRPSYPKPFKEDPAKEALLDVLGGELPLRVEAHRPDELRAALRLQQDKDVPVLVLEQAYGVAPLVNELAGTGVAVVLTEVLPGSMPERYEEFDPCELPKALHGAGVPFAIATGRARRAPLLPLMAAAAVGKGLDRDAALRAITLTPAEILGIQADTGSLTAGKLADLVVFDRPLFSSDSRVLLVLGKGSTQYEVN